MFFGNELTEQEYAQIGLEAGDLFIPHSYGIQEHDRFDVSTINSGVLTTAAGTIDSTKEIVVSGSPVSETWTVTFSDASNFTVFGAEVGALGTGDPSSEFDGGPYFTIPANFFTGSWANGETYVFSSVAEYYKVEEIKTRRFKDVDLVAVGEDTR